MSTKQCRRCGHLAPADAKFCPQCGWSPASAPPPPRPEAVVKDPWPWQRPLDAVRDWFVALSAPRQALVALVSIAVVVVGIISALGPDEIDSGPAPSETADYQRIRSECIELATAQLPRPYEVGGRRWTDDVNDCMVDKAVDEAP